MPRRIIITPERATHASYRMFKRAYLLYTHAHSPQSLSIRDRRRRLLLISLIQLGSMRDVSARRRFANCAY